MVSSNGVKGPPVGAPRPASTVRTKVGAASGRVLVVDDDAVVREVLERMLRIHGFDVITVSSGEEAVAMYQALSQAIDVVFVDMCMPGMDGYDTFKGLRTIRNDATVILCSGYADMSRVERAFHEGAFAFLAKPFNTDQLLSLMDKAMGEKADTLRPASSAARSSTRY